MQELKNKIICGDCIEILGRAKEAFADLIFADPPFNIGYKYDKYEDKVERERYIEWTREWMGACKKVLKPNGSFYIAIGDGYAANVKVIADALGLFMRNWIIWHYTFGQQTKDKFARSHTHIFYFVKDAKNFTFNDEAVRVPSARQLVYRDRRADGRGKMPDDVWGQYSRVCGTFKERVGWHPCQMPEGILKRIIAASSNKGDWVVDPFIGSGTTAVAAYELGRAYTGVDISEEYVKKAQKRLAELAKKADERRGEGRCMSMVEVSEMKRLLADVGRSAKEVAGDERMLVFFANQLSVRMDGNKKWGKEAIAAALRGLKD